MADAALDEAELFRPKDPTIENENDYEEFTLFGVDIFPANRPDALVSLFAANENYPLTIVGKLGPLEKGDQRFLQQRIPQNRLIKICNVTRFSFGQYYDGTIAFWALGSAGYFKLLPSPHSQPIFADMKQACQLLDFLNDKYRTRGTSTEPAQITHADVFRMMVESKMVESPSEAMEMVYKHRAFLIDQMHQPGKELEWEKTGIYRHLMSKRVHAKATGPTLIPYEAALAKTRTRPPAARRTASATATTAAVPSTSSRSETPTARGARRMNTVVPVKNAASTALPSPRGPGRPRKNRVKEWESAQTVWAFMRAAVRLRSIAPRDMTLEGFASAFAMNYKLDPPLPPHRFLLAHQAALVGMMQLADDGIHGGLSGADGRMRWTRTKVYRELVAQPLDVKVQDAILQAVATPRPGSRLVEAAREHEAEDEMDSGAEEDEVLAPPRRNTRGRKTKSGLRPTGGGKRYSGLGAMTEEIEEEEEEEETEYSGSDGSELVEMWSSGLLRPRDIPEHLWGKPELIRREDLNPDDVITWKVKRKYLPRDDDSDRHPSKRSKSVDPDGMDVDSDSDDVSGKSPSLPDLATTKMEALATALASSVPLHPRATPDPALPEVKRAAIASTSFHHPVLREVPRQTTKANAQGDVWECETDGCDHRVYGASGWDSQEAIRAHLRSHGDNVAERLGIIRSEGERVGMPVNNLLKRIRELAEKQAASEAPPRRRWPEPGAPRLVTRRY